MIFEKCSLHTKLNNVVIYERLLITCHCLSCCCSRLLVKAILHMALSILPLFVDFFAINSNHW